MEKKDAITILGLQVENVKRVQAVSIDCRDQALTVIGGNNRQGKSSILDAICGALGGDKFKPTNAIHGEAKKGTVEVTLSNGLKVVRSYTAKGSYLMINGEKNGKSGQSLLNEFVNSFALDLESFISAKGKKKANILLELVGMNLTPYEERYDKLYQERLEIGRDALRQKKHAEALPHHEGVPEKPITATELIQGQQRILLKNAENGKTRERVTHIEFGVEQGVHAIQKAKRELFEAEKELVDAKETLKDAEASQVKKARQLETARMSIAELEDESTAEIEAKLIEIETINAKVRDNLERERAETESQRMQEQYQLKTVALDKENAGKLALLATANMPLPELSVNDGELVYKGQPWDCMSHAEQLMVATSIVRKLNPKCGFVLLDKIEAMDVPTLKEFGKWLKAEGLQAICTRVSTGDECSLIIEDGMVKSSTIATDTAVAEAKPIKSFSDNDF